MTMTAIPDGQQAADNIMATYFADDSKQQPQQTQQKYKPVGGQGSDNITRAWNYISKIPDAISGQRGHDATYRAACECYRFGLDDDRTWELLNRFNAEKCQPQWSERELKHKQESAKQNAEYGSRITNTGISKNVEKLPQPQPADIPEQLTFMPFPVDALPKTAGEFVKAGAKAIGCDTSYLALPMLSMLASCIGTTRCLQLKNTWQELPIIWAIIIGESGSLKTPAFKQVMKPLRHLQRREIREYEQKLELHKQELVDYDKELKAYKKSRNSEQPKEPQAPVCYELLVKDTTVEALAETLKNNQRGLLLETDEIAGWINSFNSYKSGKGGDAQHYLSMHSGEPIKINRKTGNSKIIYVPVAAVSITGGIQPETLKRCLSSEHKENGLAARLLMTRPPRQPKRWNKDKNIPLQLENDLASLVKELIQLQPAYNQFNEPEPHKLELSIEAEKLWADFFNEHSNQQNELTGDLAAAWSKLEAAAARLALIIQLANEPQADNVDAASMQAGITLANWFKHEAKRVYAMLGESEQDQSQRELIELIERKGGSVTARELKQASRAYRSVSTADIEQQLNELVEAGYGHWQQPIQAGRGQPKAKRFAVNNKSNSNTVNTVNVNDNTVFNSASGNTVDVDTVDARQMTA